MEKNKISRPSDRSREGWAGRPGPLLGRPGSPPVPEPCPVPTPRCLHGPRAPAVTSGVDQSGTEHPERRPGADSGADCPHEKAKGETLLRTAEPRAAESDCRGAPRAAARPSCAPVRSPGKPERRHVRSARSAALCSVLTKEPRGRKAKFQQGHACPPVPAPPMPGGHLLSQSSSAATAATSVRWSERRNWFPRCCVSEGHEHHMSTFQRDWKESRYVVGLSTNDVHAPCEGAGATHGGEGALQAVADVTRRVKQASVLPTLSSPQRET